MGLTEEDRKALAAVVGAGASYFASDFQWWHQQLSLVWAALAEAERERVGLSSRANDAEGLLAGLADCINQELRENGPADTPQITNYLGAVDMRHFVRLLVDLVRQKSEEETGRLRAALAREVGAFAQAVREGQVPGCYLTPEQLAQVREIIMRLKDWCDNELVLQSADAALYLLGPAERPAGEGESR